MLRIKQRVSGTYALTATAVDDNGQTQQVDDPTIVVKDGAGVTVDSGVPTHSSHPLHYSLNAALLPKLDTYTVTWAGTISGNPWTWVDELELVGGYLFEIADLRTFDRAFENHNKYPSSHLADARTSVEDVLEGKKAAAVAFVPRGNRAVVDGSGTDNIVLPDFEVRGIYSISVDGVALTETEIDDLVIDDNRVYKTSGIWAKGRQNVTIHYTHGRDYAVGPIKRAALMLAKEYILASDTPSRATATSVGTQWFRVNIAGRDGVTGLPDVDAAIDQHGRKNLLIG